VANPEFLVARTQGVEAPLARPRRLAADFVALTKPRITAMVLLTEAAGTYLAPDHAGTRTRALSMVGTALIVGSANALNMWWERDVDALMTRTRNRPLPAGRLSPDVALAFGLTLGALSVPLLFLVNLATGLLGLLSLISYVAVYTPLKRHTHLALLVGAVPGAIPPLLGWATVTGSVGPGGLLLFAFLFFWQLPHFAAITVFRAEEYARAGLQVVSVQLGERAARWMIAVYALPLVGISLLFGPIGLAGRGYELCAAGLGAAFLALAFRGAFAAPPFNARRWARQVFAFSIPYLAVSLLALLADRIVS
jgi:protoheme IX farnesyltransferase